MKKTIFVLCVLLTLSPLSGCQQARPEGTKSTDVFTTRVEKATAGTDQTETLELTYDANGNLLTYQTSYRRIEYTYDASGNRLSAKQYYGNGEPESEITYCYSSDGLLLSSEGWSTMDWDLRMSSKTEYQYDSGGNTRSIKMYQDGELFREKHFDAKGNLLEECIYYGGEYDLQKTFTYDKNSRLLTERTERGGKPYGGADYTYGADGLLLYKDSYIFEGTDRKEMRETYHYDDRENLLLWSIFDYQGQPSSYAYTYDAAGNRLSEIYTSQQNSHSYQWSYDKNGRCLTEKRTNDMGTTQYAWQYGSHGYPVSYIVSYSGNETVWEFSYVLAQLSLSKEAAEQQEKDILSFAKAG